MTEARSKQQSQPTGYLSVQETARDDYNAGSRKSLPDYGQPLKNIKNGDNDASLNNIYEQLGSKQGPAWAAAKRELEGLARFIRTEAGKLVGEWNDDASEKAQLALQRLHGTATHLAGLSGQMEKATQTAAKTVQFVVDNFPYGGWTESDDVTRDHGNYAMTGATCGICGVPKEFAGRGISQRFQQIITGGPDGPGIPQTVAYDLPVLPSVVDENGKPPPGGIKPPGGGPDLPSQPPPYSPEPYNPDVKDPHWPLDPSKPWEPDPKDDWKPDPTKPWEPEPTKPYDPTDPKPWDPTDPYNPGGHGKYDGSGLAGTGGSSFGSGGSGLGGGHGGGLGGGAGTGLGAGAGGHGGGLGGGAGGVGAGAGGAAGAGRGAGLGGGLGAGMMGMGGMGGGAGAQGQDGEQETWLKEDEDPWGGNDDLPPSVLT